MKPLSKDITNEIREILEGCRDGRLKHDQDVFSCNSARCIAGWKIAFDIAKSRGKGIATAKRLRDRTITDFASARSDDECLPEWYYAKEAWGLVAQEASGLFDTDSTLDQQFALLEKLEAGERLEDK
jgi:hypothetical protein